MSWRGVASQNTEDYYAILHISRDATHEEIREAYKQQAMEWHPDKNTSRDKDFVISKFQKISEAYEVLSDVTKRKRYDLTLPDFTYKRSPSVPRSTSMPKRTQLDQLYDSFYQKKEKKAEEFLNETSCNYNERYDANLHEYKSPKPYKSVSEIDKDIYDSDVYVDVQCSMKEIYYGATKCMEVEVNVDGSPVKRVCNIKLTPGIANNTKITVIGKGNTSINGTIHDIHFIIKEMPDPVLSRDGNDIVENIKITLRQALEGVTIHRDWIDDKPIDFTLNEFPEGVVRHQIKGRGMPTDFGQRGDAVFYFHNCSTYKFDKRSERFNREMFVRVNKMNILYMLSMNMENHAQNINVFKF